MVVLSGIADEEDLLNRKLDQIRTETDLLIQGRYLGIEPEAVVDADGVQGLKVADVFPGPRRKGRSSSRQRIHSTTATQCFTRRTALIMSN